MNGEIEKEEEDRKMTGTEEAAYQKQKTESVEEGGSDDMDAGNLEEQSTSPQRIHSPKKDMGERVKRQQVKQN